MGTNLLRNFALGKEKKQFAYFKNIEIILFFYKLLA